jgi:hypothetical protein
VASFERFLESYRAHDAGLEHRFVLLCKGFATKDQLAPILERLDGLHAERIEVADDGFDLTAYRRAAAQLDGAVACYLNSNSVVLAPGWLERLVRALTPAVGMVGATGSWNSAHSSALYVFRVPGAYTRVFPDRAWHRTQSRRLHGGSGEGGDSSLWSQPPLRYLRTAAILGCHLVLFRPFPAFHVRTNAFVIRSDTMLRLRFPVLRTKMRAWRLESGRGAITEQVRGMGLETLVAGRDGLNYRPAEWAASDTLWQGEQGNLLVADNQTERYRLADLEMRTLLSKVAWGLEARPATPS